MVMTGSINITPMEVSYDDGRNRAPGIKKIALAGDSLLTALG